MTNYLILMKKIDDQINKELENSIEEQIQDQVNQELESNIEEEIQDQINQELENNIEFASMLFSNSDLFDLVFALQCCSTPGSLDLEFAFECYFQLLVYLIINFFIKLDNWSLIFLSTDFLKFIFCLVLSSLFSLDDKI